MNPRTPTSWREDGETAHRVASDTLQTLALRLLLHLLGLAASVLISRGLGPEGRGRYYFPVVVAGTTAVLSRLGLEQVNFFLFGTRGISIHRLSRQNGLVALVMGSLGAAAVLGMRTVAPGLFAETSPVDLLLAGLVIPFTLHTTFTASLLTLRGDVTAQFRAALVAGFVHAVILGALFLGAWLTVESVLAANLAMVAVAWLRTARALDGGAGRIGWDATLLSETLKHAAPTHLAMVLYFLQLRLDMFMVKALAGTEALGHYSVSVTLAETVLLATGSLALAILPHQADGTIQVAASLALRGARLSALAGSGLAVLWAGGGLVFIRFAFGDRFAPAYLPLVALLPGMVFLGMQQVCRAPALRAGRPGGIAGIFALALLVNAALNAWWIPRWGPVGAGLASTVSYGVGALVFLGWTARLARLRLAEALRPRRADLSAAWHAAVQTVWVGARG